VPFTPATGNRLLVKPGPLNAVVFKALARTLVTLTGVTEGVAVWAAVSLAALHLGVAAHACWL
jgi:predicted N-acyltransferase